ncbi:MAG: PQQ-binding-like beta-propeller repeat protein [Saprospiraceae bacterium]|jgi:quinoprotein glucose dehydrogenase|nr:PQQ-binding-like beta-propeller repeat protein [Saprospiraceae bacterium]
MKIFERNNPFISVIFLTIVVLCDCAMPKPDSTDPEEWAYYNHDPQNSKFSALDKIDTGNVVQLKKIWQFEDTTVDGSGLFFNPIVVRGKMIVLLPSNHLAALDLSTGRVLWQFVPDTSNTYNWSRSINYYKSEDGHSDLVYFIFGAGLYCLHAETGLRVASFGTQGKVDFFEGLEYDSTKLDKIFITSNAPGVIYKDLFIVGSKVPDELPSLPGDIRAFNRITGRIAWTFHTIPKPGEYGAETWGPNPREKNGGANCWAGMALDEKRGIVFIPTASPSFDFYGADRPGQNLFGNCLLALDANTGSRLWHFQTTHHDLWDRDNGSPPNLLTVNHNGRDIDAVGIVTKMAYLYLFNRETGEPLFPIEEVPVDTVSTMPGEKPWPTQPIPTKPAPFARQGFKPEYFSEATPTSAQYIKDEIQKHGYKTGIYEPPSLSGSLLLPAAHGGGNWGGASLNPHTNVLFVNSNDLPWYFALVENKNLVNNNNLSGQALFKIYCSSCHGTDMKGSVAAPDISQKVISYPESKIETILKKGVGPMPSFKHLPPIQINHIISYLKGGPSQDIHTEAKVQNEEPYSFAGYDLYKDTSGIFAIKPPFGTLTAIDLNKGENLWQVPLGENDKLLKLGLKNSGDFNRGGGIATAGGLIFIGATGDKKLRAFDQTNGAVLWEYVLPGTATSIPTTYGIKGKQYVTVAVNPDGETKFKGGYITFGLE